VREVEMELKQREIRHRRENELQKVALSLRERQFEQSLTDIKTCFEKGKQVFLNDLIKMEKLAKKMRKSRRRVKTKQITELNQKEIEFDDLLSNSGYSLEEMKTEKHENEDNLSFEVGLGGVIIRKNGEINEQSVSAKWDSNCDESNSYVLFNIIHRKILHSKNTHTIILHT